ncbi:hypothetical protein PQR21_32880 [Paraburkholderia nemoris]|uniref:hypothetical protein n=1 Tax=Paraburkholderia nemoris TaxID=2793076 RepID=UPI0038B7CCEE
MSSSARGSSAGHGSPRLHQLKINLIVGAFAAVPRSRYAIGMSVDGGKATTISTAANDRQTVNIALTIAGPSDSTYSDAAGVSRNNVGIAARTIVNQVAGSNPRIISGLIDLIGSRRRDIGRSERHWMNDGSFAGVWARTCSQFDVQNCCVDSGAITRST